jgi:hypothetical protein
MNAKTNAASLTVALRGRQAGVTWNADRTGLVLRLSNGEVNLALHLGPDVATQLRQALSWAPDGDNVSCRLAI